jgi:hypothetical protein
MDDAEARDILRAHGEDTTDRGRLSATARARAQHFADQDAAAGPDYDGGVTDADFSPAPEPVAGFAETVAAEPAEPAPPAPLEERRPRRPTRARKPLLERLTAKDKAKPKGRKPPRVSTASMVSNAWAALGGMVQRADPPLGRCLIFQADTAGDILDDLVKGTFFDPALQWAARAELKGRKAAALFGPPMCVAIIEHAQNLPEPQRSVRMALAEPMLITCLMLMDEVSADRAEERLERHRIDGPRREQAVKMAQMIFAMADAAPAPEGETVGV